jgi:hypothetical protein
VVTPRAVKFRDTFRDLAGIHESEALAELAERVHTDFVKRGRELTNADENELITAAAATLRPQGGK